MQIRLHKLAKTTPATRLEIKKSTLKASEIAKNLGLNLDTVYKWKKREDVNDKSHARHKLLSSLTSIEENIVVELRVKVGLSLDDITEVMNRCINPKLTRSAIYRAMKRRGVSKKPVITTDTEYQKFEQATECGHIHMDVKYLPKLDGKRSYLYVAIDRLTRYVYAEILYSLEPETASAFVERFIKHFPHKVIKIVTDNGFEWTDRCSGGVKEKATGKHAVDLVCEENKVKHTLTKIRRPQTNGMVERFNRRVNEVIASKAKISKNSGKNSFASHEERNDFIMKFINNYNKTRLRCLDYNAPISLLNSNMPPGNHTEYNIFSNGNITA